MLDGDGSLLWKKESAKSPSVTHLNLFLGEKDEIFISIGFIQFNHEVGTFAFEDGRSWQVKNLKGRQVVARLDADTGALLWENDMDVISANQNELLAIRPIRKAKKTQYKVSRFTYSGKLKKSFRTRWVRGYPSDAIRFKDGLAVILTREILKNRRVKNRFDELHVFDFKGNQILTKKLSDQSFFSKRESNAPLRIVSPIETLKIKSGVILRGRVRFKS